MKQEEFEKITSIIIEDTYVPKEFLYNPDASSFNDEFEYIGVHLKPNLNMPVKDRLSRNGTAGEIWYDIPLNHPNFDLTINYEKEIFKDIKKNKETIKIFIEEFRNWQRQWDLFSKQETFNKPKHIDEFIDELIYKDIL